MDRLASITSPAFSASYDGDGLRATKAAGGVTTYFLYDGDTPVCEEAWSGTSASFKSLNGWTADGWRTRYDQSSGQAYVFLYDPQGSLVQRQSPHAYAGSSGAYDETFYEGFGALRQDVRVYPQAVSQYDPVGFGGQYGYYTDTETGLLCLTHRYYDPGTGKFLNRDPIGYAGGENLYGFCDGNPVNEMDPDGTSGEAVEDLKGLGDTLYGSTIGAGIVGQTQNLIYQWQLIKKYGYVRGSNIYSHQMLSGLVHSYTDAFTSNNPRARTASATNIALTLLLAGKGRGVLVEAADVPKPVFPTSPGTQEMAEFTRWGAGPEDAMARLKSITPEDVAGMKERGLTLEQV